MKKISAGAIFFLALFLMSFYLGQEYYFKFKYHDDLREATHFAKNEITYLNGDNGITYKEIFDGSAHGIERLGIIIDAMQKDSNSKNSEAAKASINYVKSIQYYLRACMSYNKSRLALSVAEKEQHDLRVKYLESSDFYEKIALQSMYKNLSKSKLAAFNSEFDASVTMGDAVSSILKSSETLSRNFDGETFISTDFLLENSSAKLLILTNRNRANKLNN